MGADRAEPRRIVLSNDDGIHAEGLQALAGALRPLAEVWVIAPDRERSGSSHAITLYRPLRARQVEEHCYAVDGTPTDCINLAHHHLLRGLPISLVVSGINAGRNAGDDVTYSGTLGAAIEASLLGYPALALSQDVGGEYSMARTAAFAVDLVAAVLDGPAERGLLLSVNVPCGLPKGWALTRLGRRFYREVVVEKTDPRGEQYYWIAGTPDWQGGAGTDHEALENGLISITPLRLDLTDFDALSRNHRWQGRLEERLAQKATT